MRAAVVQLTWLDLLMGTDARAVMSKSESRPGRRMGHVVLEAMHHERFTVREPGGNVLTIHSSHVGKLPV